MKLRQGKPTAAIVKGVLGGPSGSIRPKTRDCPNLAAKIQFWGLTRALTFITTPLSTNTHLTMSPLLIVGMALAVIGGLLALIFGIILLIKAFQTHVLWGLGYLFVPFVGLVFVIKYWDDTKSAFLKTLLGSVLAAIGGGLVASQSEGIIEEGTVPPPADAYHALAEPGKKLV